MDDGTLRQLGREIWQAMREDPQFQSLLREIVLSVYATTDRVSREGYVRALLRHCREKGASLHVNVKGGLIVSNGGRLSPDVRDALRIYRLDIIETMSPRRNGVKGAHHE